MNIYLSHNFEAKEWLRTVIFPDLDRNGHVVTSTWLDAFYAEDVSCSKKMEDAEIDLRDIDRSDIVIHFCQSYEGHPGLGKFVEIGYAMAKGIPILAIAPQEDANIFYFGPRVKRLKSMTEALGYLEGYGDRAVYDMLRASKSLG